MKRKIEDIKIDADKLQNELKLRSTRQRYTWIRKYAGGVCTNCCDIPTKRVSYDIGETKPVEWCCEKCFNYRKDGRGKKDIDKLLS